MGHHSLPEAREKLADLIDRALAGEEVVILRDGQPVVEIKAVAKPADEGYSAEDMIRWLDEHRVRPAKPITTDAGELLHRMRNEEWR